MVFTRIKKDVLEILYAHNIWWHDFFFQDYDYERDEVNKILDLLKNSDDIIVLQGIRGIGKTVIIKQAIKNYLIMVLNLQIFYIFHWRTLYYLV